MRVSEFVCVYWNLYACISICMRVLEFVCVYWNLYACIGICMRVSEFACVYRNLYALQNTSFQAAKAEKDKTQKQSQRMKTISTGVF